MNIYGFTVKAQDGSDEESRLMGILCGRRPNADGRNAAADFAKKIISQGR